MHRHLVYALGFVVAAVVASPAPAQSPADSPWLAWYGCWSSTSDAGAALAGQPVTCVLPAPDGNPQSVERLVLVNSRVTDRRAIVADGSRRAIEDANCTGWESAQFSDDRARVYFSGELQCGTLPPQQSSGVLSLTAWSEWLRVDAVVTGAEERLAIQRAKSLPWAVLPASVLEELRPLERAAEAARAAASLNLRAEQITDVGAASHAAVSTAWLVETAQSGQERFRLTRSDLLALHRAGVEDRVVDAAVAAAHPDRFLVSVQPRDGRLTSVAENGPAGILASQRFGGVGCGAVGNPLMMDGPGSLTPYRMAALYFPDCLPLQAFGWYGLGPFGQVGQWPGFFPNHGGYPVTVVVTPISPSGGSASSPRGAVVNGSGYRAPSTTSPSARSSGNSGASGGNSGASASGGSSNSGRTAKQRNP